MIVDANANVGPTVYEDFEFEPTLEGLADAHDAADIDRGLVSSLKPPALDFATANERLASRLENWDRFDGIARIDPRVSDAAQQAERALVDLDFEGLKLHPWEESFSITAELVEPILAVARDHDTTVWVHAGYPGVSHALSVRDVAQGHPEVRFVLTHGAQLDISGLSLPDAVLCGQDTDNTYFELSGVYRRDLIEDLVESLGPDRVVFGTNAPSFHPTVEKRRITAAEIGTPARREVLAETVQTLLD